jgi:hypothetical protein
MDLSRLFENEKEVSFGEFLEMFAGESEPLIRRRGYRNDGKLPTEFKLGDYYDTEIASATKNLRRVEKMTLRDAEKMVKKEFNRSADIHDAYVTRKRGRLQRSITMLRYARRWKPPTPAHERLKVLMMQFLIDRVDENSYVTGECPRPRSAKEYRRRERKRARQRLADAIRGKKREIEAIAEATAWVKDLRESVHSEVE